MLRRRKRRCSFCSSNICSSRLTSQHDVMSFDQHGNEVRTKFGGETTGAYHNPRAPTHAPTHPRAPTGTRADTCRRTRTPAHRHPQKRARRQINIHIRIHNNNNNHYPIMEIILAIILSTIQTLRGGCSPYMTNDVHCQTHLTESNPIIVRNIQF